jgi:hypothetical protein
MAAYFEGSDKKQNQNIEIAENPENKEWIQTKESAKNCNIKDNQRGKSSEGRNSKE